MPEHRYVILGGGVAGGYAVQELIKNGTQPGEVVLISDDDLPPYERPPLSKGFLTGKKERDGLYINEPGYYTEHGIDLWLKTRIRRFFPSQRRLVSATGQSFTYEKLLLATGSRVRGLAIPGTHLEGLYYLRWFHDAESIRSAAERGGRAGVVGGGYIGMEVAASLAARGVDVTLVYDSDRLLPRLFTPEMAAYFEDYYRARGVRLVPQSRAAALKGDDAVDRLVLTTGDELPVDFVVAGVGVFPALDVCRDTAVVCSEGVVVNEFLETSIEGVYAAGDVAEYPDPLFEKRRRVEHWDNAVEQGRCAARNMTGHRAPFRHVPYFFSDVFDLSWEFWGDTDGANRVVYRGEIGDGSFSAWWLQEDRLVAAFVMNRPDDERERALEWIRDRRRFAPGALEASELPEPADRS